MSKENTGTKKVEANPKDRSSQVGRRNSTANSYGRRMTTMVKNGNQQKRGTLLPTNLKMRPSILMIEPNSSISN